MPGASDLSTAEMHEHSLLLHNWTAYRGPGDCFTDAFQVFVQLADRGHTLLTRRCPDQMFVSVAMRVVEEIHFGEGFERFRAHGGEDRASMVHRITRHLRSIPALAVRSDHLLEINGHYCRG